MRITRRKIRMMIRESIRRQVRLNEFDLMGTFQKGAGMAQDVAGDLTKGSLQIPDMPGNIQDIILNPMKLPNLIKMPPVELGDIIKKIPGGLTEDMAKKNPSIFLKVLELIPGVGPFVEDLKDAIGDEFEDYAAEVLEEAKKKCVKWPILKIPPYEIDYKCAARIARKKAERRMNAKTAIDILQDAFSKSSSGDPFGMHRTDWTLGR